jgi:hypothetical protein
MQSEGNTPKNGEPTVGLSFITMLQHTGQFWSKISFSKEQCDNTETSPTKSDLAPADSYLFPPPKSAFKGTVLL